MIAVNALASNTSAFINNSISHLGPSLKHISSLQSILLLQGCLSRRVNNCGQWENNLAEHQLINLGNNTMYVWNRGDGLHHCPVLLKSLK